MGEGVKMSKIAYQSVKCEENQQRQRKIWQWRMAASSMSENQQQHLAWRNIDINSESIGNKRVKAHGNSKRRASWRSK